jgi:hypothetical protein
VSKSTKAHYARWNNLNEAFKNYVLYIERKPDRFELSIIDLLYIVNFKGGNSSVVSSENHINEKLKAYSERLVKINEKFDGKSLRNTDHEERKLLKELAQKFIELPLQDNNIKGLGPSYASALLCAHFPNLLPIIDQFVLAGFNITSKPGQVKKIERYYDPLINCFYKEMNKTQNKDLTLREIDQTIFVKGHK